MGREGSIVDSLATLPNGQTHSAHFNSAFQAEFTQFGVALTSQIASVPLPSPASGFTYQFDSALGVFQRTSQSFGPILSERAETIGGGRFTFGFTFQNFSFDTIEGLDLNSVPAVFTHDSAELLGGRQDVVTTVNSIDARVNQFTAFISYGLTDRMDLSLAIPVVSTDMTVRSDATIERIGTTDPLTHFYREANDTVGTERVFTAFGSASGIGDLTLRLKGRLAQSMALGLDVRIPTGDEQNLLGVGAAGIRPFVVLSHSAKAFSPHVNVGYQWNGSSVLAGNPANGTSADLPDQVTYVAGADFGVSQRFTFVLDIIGNYFLKAPRLHEDQFHALDGHDHLSYGYFQYRELQRPERCGGVQAERHAEPSRRRKRAVQSRQQRSPGQDHSALRVRVRVLAGLLVAAVQTPPTATERIASRPAPRTNAGSSSA